MNLEDQLRNALKREDPPAGFAERVLNQTGPGRARYRPTPPKPRLRFMWPSMAAAAAAVALTLGVAENRRSQQEAAGRQAIQALQVVAEELNIAQIEVLNK